MKITIKQHERVIIVETIITLFEIYSNMTLASSSIHNRVVFCRYVRLCT